jgi:ATP-dependent Clp protease ATP-binding subunit ClpA
MYERFTDRARKVLQLANQEAQRFNHEYIGTEHILLGLFEQGAGVAANVLQNLDIDLCKTRLEIEKIVQAGPGLGPWPGKLPQTPRAKKVIEYAIEEARHFQHNYVGTEHLLLGLLREQEGVAAQILIYLGLKLEDVREEVLNLLRPSFDELPPEGNSPKSNPPKSNSPKDEILELPAEVQRAAAELVAQIEQLTQDKEAAVAEGDFERAAHLLDRADKLKRKKEVVLRDWGVNYPVSDSWLFWNGNLVAKIAQEIATERRWEDLPVLADALEEAGCTDLEILRHCRQSKEHGSRCWVVDLLVNKS